MGREMRRAQERAERRQKQHSATAPRATFSAPPVAGEERGGEGRRWLGDIVSELRKVTWPTRQETMNLTGVVIIVSLALGVLLGGADLLFGWLVEQTLLR